MATSKSYLAAPETAIVFTASGGDVAFTLDSVATVSGRQSAQHDFGASARAFMFNWRAWVKIETTPVVGETIDFYYKSGYTTSTRLDNDDGTGDIAVSAEDKLKNLKYIGAIVADEAAEVPMSASGIVYIPDRYVHVVWWNASAAKNLSSTAGDHKFLLTPIPYESQ